MLASTPCTPQCVKDAVERLSTDSMRAAEAAGSAEGDATMKRKGFLPLAAASVAVLLAGCVSGYQYREGAGDYYYGQPSVEYRDYGYGGYGYPGGWGGSFGFGYGYPYGGYGYPYGGYGYPYYPPLIYLPGYYGGHHHHHGGRDQSDPAPYRPAHPPRRVGGDGTAQTPIMMPSAPYSRVQEPREPRPDIREQSLPPRRAFTLPPTPRTERNESGDPPRIQVPERSNRDRDGRRNPTR